MRTKTTIMIVNKASAQPTTIDVIMGKNKILDYGPDPLLANMLLNGKIDRQKRPLIPCESAVDAKSYSDDQQYVWVRLHVRISLRGFVSRYACQDRPHQTHRRVPSS